MSFDEYVGKLSYATMVQYTTFPLIANTYDVENIEHSRNTNSPPIFTAPIQSLYCNNKI